MKRKTSKYLSAVTFIIGIILGITILIYIKKWNYFALDSNVSIEMNPLEFPVLLANLFLAVYIVTNVARNQDLKKSEKELIINSFIEYKTLLNDSVYNLLDGKNFDDPLVISRLKVLRKRFYSLMQICEVSTVVVDESELSATKLLIDEIWERFTEAPKPAAKNANKDTKEGIENIRLEKISRIEQILIDTEQKINVQIIKINNSN